LPTLIDIANALSLNTDILAKQAGYSSMDLIKEMRLYWISWIAISSDGKPYQLSTQNGCISYEKAKETKQHIQEHFNDLIAIWIDEYKNDQKIMTRDLTVLIDALGNRKHSNKGAWDE
jgi:hypothetical protein